MLFAKAVSDDPYDRFAREDLIDEGVDVAGLIADKATNTVGAFAFINETGKRYLWGGGGQGIAIPSKSQNKTGCLCRNLPRSPGYTVQVCL